MKITDYISYMIERLPKGYVFTYVDFTTEGILLDISPITAYTTAWD